MYHRIKFYRILIYGKNGHGLKTYGSNFLYCLWVLSYYFPIWIGLEFAWTHGLESVQLWPLSSDISKIMAVYEPV